MHSYKSCVIYFVVFALNNDRCIRNISAVTVTPASTLTDNENEKQIMQKYLENSDVVQFNVGGEIMFTSRASLLHVADSKLFDILLNKSRENLSIDQNNNTFLDFNPELFRHLLEQLRLLEHAEEAIFHPPSTPAVTKTFVNMLDKLGLKSAPISDDDILTFNVGDEIIATQRKTLSRVPNSKLSSLVSMNKPSDFDSNGKPFLDYDPKLFRHLLSQLQAGKITDFEAPSIESTTAYNKMLNNLGLEHK